MSPEMEKRLKMAVRRGADRIYGLAPYNEGPIYSEAVKYLEDTFRPLLRQDWNAAIEKAAGALRGSREGCMCYEKNLRAIRILKEQK